MSDVIDFTHLAHGTKFRYHDAELVLAQPPRWTWGQTFDVGKDRRMQDVALEFVFLRLPKETAAPQKSSWSKRMGLRKAEK